MIFYRQGLCSFCRCSQSNKRHTTDIAYVMFTVKSDIFFKNWYSLLFFFQIDKEDEMVQCCSNHCVRQFHLLCVGLDVAPPARDDWYSCEECEFNSSYIYCICHKSVAGEMVQWSFQGDCKCYEWFHIQCLSPEEKSIYI